MLRMADYFDCNLYWCLTCQGWKWCVFQKEKFLGCGRCNTEELAVEEATDCAKMRIDEGSSNLDELS